MIKISSCMDALLIYFLCFKGDGVQVLPFYFFLQGRDSEY